MCDTGNSDKGANVTLCDLVVQLEGCDTQTQLTVGHEIWLKDVDKCLEDVTGIITGVGKLEKG